MLLGMIRLCSMLIFPPSKSFNASCMSLFEREYQTIDAVLFFDGLNFAIQMSVSVFLVQIDKSVEDIWGPRTARGDMKIVNHGVSWTNRKCAQNVHKSTMKDNRKKIIHTSFLKRRQILCVINISIKWDLTRLQWA